MGSRNLQQLLAAAEARKHADIRERLGIPVDARIEALQLEALVYHLTERSGPAWVKLEGEMLRVGENPAARGLCYTGDAIEVLLRAWKISLEEASAGISIEVLAGQRAG